MTTLNKTQKVTRWASEKKTRSFSKAMKELGQENERTFRLFLNRMSRKGIINYEIVGRKVSLRLTQEAYYNRSELVIAR